MDYATLITFEHRDKPKFVATVRALANPVDQVVAAITSLVSGFDLDTAVGNQLDVVGQWVDQSRFLGVELTGVYFSLDVEGLGLDEGTLLGPDDSSTGLARLPDDAYRVLLRAKIAENQWDGQNASAQAIIDTLNSKVVMFDNQDMSLDLALYDAHPDAVTTALFRSGFLGLKPAGVRINNFYRPSVTETPLFGLDADNTVLGGLDHGSLAVTV